jgi:YgiT-type zinc finger domain-containing protein
MFIFGHNPMEASGAVMESDTMAGETCSQCGRSELRQESVRSAFWEGDRLVVVEDIPALVCGSCGERFFDDSTTVMIDRLRGDGFPLHQAQRELRVPVFSLRDRLKR